MPHAAAITPMEMATTCAKTCTSGIMARAGEGLWEVCIGSYVPPTGWFPSRRSDSRRDYSIDRRIGVLLTGAKRGRLLAQELFHRGLGGDRVGDLVANSPRGVEGGGDGLDAGTSHLQAEQVEADALQCGDGGGEAFGGKLAGAAQLVAQTDAVRVGQRR